MYPDRHLNELRFRAFTGTNDLVAFLTPARIRKYVNPAYCKFFNSTEAELLHTPIFNHFSDESREKYSEFIARMTPQNPSISVVRKSGTENNFKWIQWTEIGIYDEAGLLVEVVSVGRDIDDIIQTKINFGQNLSLLNAYQEAVDVGLICSITDFNGIIRYVNRRFCDVSQYEPHELIGQSHSIINSGLHTSDFFAELWHTIRAGKTWKGEIRNRAKDGTFYWVETVIIPINENTNQEFKYLSLRIDITAQKSLQAEKIDYMKSLENMMYCISHEVRRPITTTMGLINILQNENISAKEQGEIVSFLHEASIELDYYSRKMHDFIVENRNKQGLLEN
jgi:PAS domain S-box-containing protein